MEEGQEVQRQGWGGSAALEEGAIFNSGGMQAGGGSHSIISRKTENASRMYLSYGNQLQ